MMLCYPAVSAPIRETNTNTMFQISDQNQGLQISFVINGNDNTPPELHFGSDTNNQIIIFHSDDPFFEGWAG